MYDFKDGTKINGDTVPCGKGRDVESRCKVIPAGLTLSLCPPLPAFLRFTREEDRIRYDGEAI